MRRAPPPIRPSLIDRAIAALSPAWALSRHKNRSAMALTGGYAGAGYQERLAYWNPGLADADGDALTGIRELRGRSRDLARNSPIAGGAIETAVSNVVGSGLTLQCAIDGEALGLDDEAVEEWQEKTERLFSMWANSPFASCDAELNFAELQELGFRTHLESGDAFVILPAVSRPNWPFTLALQLVEADRVCNPNRTANSDTMTEGIERLESGEAVAAHVTNRHPGAYFDQRSLKWTRVVMRGASGRRNVLHLVRKLRPGQTRGIPWLAPIIEPLKQLGRYSLAEVDAAVNSAVFATFVKMDPDTFTEVFDDEAQDALLDSAKRWDGTLKSGAAINLLPGEEIQSTTPGRPNPNFDPFVSAVMRQIGMALNIPHEVLTKHFQASYSAARAALLDAWRVFRIRRLWLAGRLCQPTYEEWLADAVSTGLITAPGFFADPIVRDAWCRATWAGDGPGALDPLKEAQAARERMAIGVTTLAEETVAYDGGDWQAKHDVAVRIKTARVDGGLEVPVAPDPGTPGMMPPGGPARPAPAPAPAPNDDQSGDPPVED